MCRAFGAQRRLQRQLLIEFPVDASVRNLPRSAPGTNLASDIPLTEYGQENYLEPTHSIFSLKPPTVETVYNLLTKIDEKKISWP